MAGIRAMGLLARGTWVQAVRSRLLWVSVIFVVLLVALSMAAASVAIYEQARIIVDVGLAACSAVGTVVALGTSVAFFSAELQQRTAYPILARPLPRWSFVAGKALGLTLAMGAMVAAMGAATAGVVFLFAQAIPFAFVSALWLTWVELMVVVAVGLLFATVAVPALAATYAGAVVLAGHLSQDLLMVAAKQPPPTAALLRGAYAILPDLSRLSLRSQAANALPVPDGYVMTATLYGGVYAALALGLAMVAFSRRQAL